MITVNEIVAVAVFEQASTASTSTVTVVPDNAESGVVFDVVTVPTIEQNQLHVCYFFIHGKKGKSM